MGGPRPLPWLTVDIRANSVFNSKSTADPENGGVYHPGQLPSHVVTGSPLVLDGFPLPPWDDWIHNHRILRHRKSRTQSSRTLSRVVPRTYRITWKWLDQYNQLKERLPPPWRKYHVLSIQWSSVMHVLWEQEP